MKKKITAILLIFVILAQFTVTCIADNNVSVVLNGNTLSFDVPPTIIDGRTMVPMRVIFEELGYTIEWNEIFQYVIATNNDTKLQISIGSHTVEKWGKKYETYETDVAPCIIDGRTFVPVRIISELSGCNVNFDAENRAVIITKGTSNTPSKSIFNDKYKSTVTPVPVIPPAPVIPSEPASGTENETSYQESSNIVWVGETGNKYHRESCSTLSGRKYKMTLQEAKAEGREACKRCKP